MNVGNQITATTPTDDADQLQDALSNTSLHTTEATCQQQTFVARSGLVIAGTEVLFTLGLVAAAFCLPHVIESTVDHPAQHSSYAYLMFAHAGVWFIVFVCDLLFSVHHRRLKMTGYLKFYRSVRLLQRQPFIVKSFGIIALLALTTHFQYQCKVITDDCHLISLTPIMVAQILTSLETAVILLGLVIYVGRIIIQNRYQQGPDESEDQMLTSFRQHNLSPTEGVGFRADNYMDDIVEHQADTIRSLKEQNAILSRKLYALTNKTGSRHRS